MILRRLAAFAGLALLAGNGFAQGYAQRTQNVRAAVLTLDATRYPGVNTPPANDTPFVWFNVDSNKRVKPTGWNFYNPLAPGIVDDVISTRWSAITSIMGGTAPGTGSPIDKRKAAYWELRLSTATDAQMSSYDILLFSGYRSPISLNSAEREKLRKFVDAGGILWVDLAHDPLLGPGQPNIDVPNNFPIPVLDAATTTGPLTFADVFHPLMTTPNTLTISNLESLATEGDKNTLGTILASTPGLFPINQIVQTLPEESQRLLAVAGVGNQAVVGVGRLGDGFIVVTTRGYANAINRVRLSNNTFDPNNRYDAVNPGNDRVADIGAKFVINMVNLASSFGQSQAGSRKQNSSPVDLGGPVLKRFDVAPGNASPNAVIYKGLLVVTTDTQVLVYDANPISDLDGDGTPDDGWPDFALGSGSDLIWSSRPLSGPISAPICAEIPNTINGAPKDQILVVDGKGQLNAYDAFPIDPTGRLTATLGVITPSYVIPPPSTPPTVGTPLAPTFHENLIVVADTVQSGLGNNVGRVWLADAKSGQLLTTGADYVIGGASGSLPEISAPPVVGYIPIADNSGGVDRVIYVAGRAGSNGAFPTASISSIWVGSKGEVPAPGTVTFTAGSLSIQTRAFKQGLPIYLPPAGTPANDPLWGFGIKLTVIDANGNPLVANQLGGPSGYFTNSVTEPSPGQLDFTLQNPLPTNPDGSLAVSFRLDYTVDWGNVNAALSGQLVRGSINFPDDLTLSAASRRHILGNLALSPRGTISAVVSTGDNSTLSAGGGSFYEVREEGRGAFRMLVRYDLYPSHTFSLAGGSPVTIPTTLDDNDPLASTSPWLSGNFSNLTFSGGPTLRNDVVYVTAQGMKSDPAMPFKHFVPFTVVMAFRGEPDNPTIRVGDFPDGSSIYQPDIVQTPGGQKTVPNHLNSLQNTGSGTQYTYDADTGVVTINSLANTNRGQIGAALSLSQPVIIKSPNGAPDRWLWPDANGGNWNPLLWYTVLHGTSNTSAPFVAGNTLYVAGTTALPSVITTFNFTPPADLRNNGVGFAMDANISPTDPYIVTNTGRAWNSQVTRLKVTGADAFGPQISANPDIRWPQAVGTNSFETFVQRLLQTEIGSTAVGGTATSGVGVIGGDRAVVLIGQNAGGTVFSSFSRSDVIVADQGRVSKFDPSGNPVWSTDASSTSGATDISVTGNVHGVVRPTRAYPYGDSDVLAVDPGGNRIIKLDAAGHETRTIGSFQVDTNFVPDGYQTNESSKFDSPSDVATFNEFVPGPRVATNPFTNAAPLEYWYHYVVADTGNHRLVDLIDRYKVDPITRRVLDPVTVFDPIRNVNVAQLNVLAWHTPATFSGKKYEYSSVTRIVPTTVGGSNYYYVAGLGSAMPTKVDSGLDAPSGGIKPREAADGNGGIVVFDPSNATPPAIINEVQIPNIGANALWNDTTATFNSAAIPAHAHRISSLSSVTARNIGSVTAVMFTDSTGVYEVIPQGGNWVVRWMLPNEIYRVMRGIYNVYDLTSGRGGAFQSAGTPSSSNAADLRATYARRLDSGEVIVVNGYSGTTRGTYVANGAFTDRVPFGGEVLQIDGDLNDDLNNPVNPANPNKFPGFSFAKTNLGFGFLSIKFELPPITGARSLLQPVFADRR